MCPLKLSNLLNWNNTSQKCMTQSIQQSVLFIFIFSYGLDDPPHVTLQKTNIKQTNLDVIYWILLTRLLVNTELLTLKVFICEWLSCDHRFLAKNVQKKFFFQEILKKVFNLQKILTVNINVKLNNIRWYK